MNRLSSTDDARFLELLERWHTGAFTAADERKLHALLQGDPFLREAWEGCIALPEVDHTVYLARIRQRLRGAIQNRRTRFVLWMSAAAAVMVLLTTAVYFWPKASHTDLTPMAQMAETAPLDTSEGLATARDLADAPAATEPASPFSGPTAAVPRSSRAKQESNGAVWDDHLAADMATAEESAGVAPAAREAMEEVARMEDARSAPARQPQSAPAAPVAVEAADKMVATEVAKPAAPAGNTRKKQDSALAKEMAKPATPVIAAEPKGGWEDFQAFVRRQAQVPPAARDNNIRGIVRLQFAVGPDGRPADVQVLQALGYGCDEEAVRLVRLFEWSPVGARAVVEVPIGQ